MISDDIISPEEYTPVMIAIVTLVATIRMSARSPASREFATRMFNAGWMVFIASVRIKGGTIGFTSLLAVLFSDMKMSCVWKKRTREFKLQAGLIVSKNVVVIHSRSSQGDRFTNENMTYRHE